MKTIKITILSARDDGSETKIDDLVLTPNDHGEFLLQDHPLTVHGEMIYFGISVASNGNMHLGLSTKPFRGLAGHLYAQVIVDCMSRFGGPPVQVVARIKSGCLVRFFAQSGNQ